MDVSGISQSNGASIIQWPDNGGSNQQWLLEAKENGYYQLTARHSGKAVYASTDAEGAAVYQWEVNNNDAQRWLPEPVGNGYYKLINKVSGKVLSVTSAATTDGASLVQTTWDGGDEQQWQFESLSSDARMAERLSMENASLIAFPNPASSVLTVEVNGASEAAVTLVNLLGREVQPDYITRQPTQIQLGVASLKNGVYLLKVYSAGKPLSKKVMIQR
jgi:hypothetical protein